MSSQSQYKSSKSEPVQVFEKSIVLNLNTVNMNHSNYMVERLVQKISKGPICKAKICNFSIQRIVQQNIPGSQVTLKWKKIHANHKSQYKLI